MATKQVIISNIKFNLSTEPLVNDPEVYPDNLYYSFTTAGIYFTVYFD